MGGSRGGFLFCFVFCRVPEVSSGKLRRALRSECFAGCFFFLFSQTTGTLRAKGDCGEDVSRWPLRIADRVGWNPGQDLPPEDCACDVQMMVSSRTGSSALLKIIKLKMRKDKTLNTGEYFIFGEKYNLRFILFFYSVYVCGYVHANLGDPGGQGIR